MRLGHQGLRITKRLPKGGASEDLNGELPSLSEFREKNDKQETARCFNILTKQKKGLKNQARRHLSKTQS